MAVKFYNTLSRSLEEFVPLDPAGKHVGMYCCGPTIHDFAHIGNFRTFVFTDLLRRFLEFRGYDVKHVMNITDVEDKIIKRVRQANEVGTLSDQFSPSAINIPVGDGTISRMPGQKITLRDYTSKYEAAFLEDLKTLGCKSPSVMPRATEYIPQIVALIEKLIARGIAYQAADGSVYFSIDKYRGCGCKYGQLVNLNFDGMRVGERVASDEYEKESLADFALWKSRVPDDGEVFWDSPWGQGRPGWHIECSAMSMDVLGTSFDIHAGGEDLMFPHHEDEIAQSEGAGVQAPGQKFVKYWLHGSHLLVEGKKMSKSLGNFFTLRDLLGKGFNGREIRYLMISAHYRAQFNFTLEGLSGARTALARIDECLLKLREIAGQTAATGDSELIKRFTEALDEDLNIAAAWGTVFEWVSETNRKLAANELTAAQAAIELKAWDTLDQVLGIGAKATDEVPAELLALLEERQAARKAKDFKRSDAIRDELKAKGWVIEDTPKGPRLKKL